MCDFLSFAVDEFKTLPGDAEFDRSPRRQLAFRSDLHPTSFLLQPAERLRLRIAERPRLRIKVSLRIRVSL